MVISPEPQTIVKPSAELLVTFLISQDGPHALRGLSLNIMLDDANTLNETFICPIHFLIFRVVQHMN